MAKAQRRPSTLGIIHEGDCMDSFIKSADQWLEDKKRFDGAEGLWRVHDGLYDLTHFVETHPGGRFWIETTQGLDITESWESHHISSKAEQLLPKYFVRKARTPRNSPFTFHEDGFYKTLKGRVRSLLPHLPKDPIKTSNWIFDILFVVSVLLSTLATLYSSHTIGISAGICMAFTLVAGHNYYHKADNFRLYPNYVFMLNSRDFRIVHVLSHHAFPNSVSDLQAHMLEPLVLLYPGKKSFVTKYLSYIYVPLMVWPMFFLGPHVIKLYQWIFSGKSQHIRDDLLAWILPLFLYVATKQPPLNVLTMWVFIMLVNGFWFGLVGFTLNHYHPDIFMDGDVSRYDESDWGVSQVDTAGEKIGMVNTHFLGLIFLGDHVLHHLFPVMDHGVIQYLYPVFRETMREFKLDLQVFGKGEFVGGYFRRLSTEDTSSRPVGRSRYHTKVFDKG
ncbi:cytochrome b5-related protein-like isoform X2 [Photinus pyralis]|nr:cytochrome b5-related protein-like isoform X2 [Photinus pyralis]XP_031331641.1 cytochrome b5-related protein-like isoform X2 [Photinus pyralis]XP_031331642.1 cytochrome b5-related protein-like isoform X2 [Photinus pyralis]